MQFKNYMEGSVYEYFGLIDEALGAASNASERFGVKIAVNRAGSIMSVFFEAGEVRDYNSALHSDLSIFTNYFLKMQDNGIYIAPSQFEAMFISYAHDNTDIEITETAIGEAFSGLI